MNDRFKFRVFLKYNQAMYNIDSFCYLEGLNKSVFHFKQGGQKTLKNDDFVLMQSTGLKDKNGKLIYEGDIVKPLSDFVVGYLGEIKFGKKENYQCFYVDWHTKHPILRGDLYYWLEDKDEGLEVIGNKFENLELLKECDNE